MAGVVIIGAGECGVRAAFALREQGFAGPVTLIGDEAEPPYERPPLSKAADDTPKAIRAAGAYADARIDLRLGTRVQAIDRVQRLVRTDAGQSLPYDRLVLATGARARLFPGMEGCLTLRTAADARAILSRFTPGARIGIIGGGFIGLELASTARKRGVAVTVIEAAPRLLARAVPEAIASVLCHRHRDEGVDLRLGTGVALADAQSITLAHGSRLTFDAVVAGVGALPNTELAESAGLAVNNGIVVDADFRTSDPAIHAAGDCCAFEWRGARVRLESWKAAQDQAVHVAGAIMGARADYARVPWFWSDQYDLTLQVAGLFEPSLTVHRRDTQEETTMVFQVDAQRRLVAAAGIGPGNSAARDLRILEKLIERGAVVDPNDLADGSQPLKRLLKAG